jgi:hypothetical protein
VRPLLPSRASGDPLAAAPRPFGSGSTVALWIADVERRYPLLLQLLAAYVFLLPLQSVQIPSAVAGFSVNPARLMAFGLIALLTTTVCLFRGRNAFDRLDKYVDPSMLRWTVFLVVSLAWYYIQIGFGHGLRFADADSFFRSWRGRPLGLFFSYASYAIIPYLLVRRYAAEVQHRRLIETALGYAIFLLVWYGYFQQGSFLLGLPTTGRLLYEGGAEGMRLPTYGVAGLSLLRFYSLGGEPRDYGTFALGALLFFLYWREDRGIRTRLTAAALAVSFFLTMSTSAFAAALLFMVLAVVDAVVQGFVSFKAVVRTFGYGLLAAVVIIGTAAEQLFGERTLEYIRAISSLAENSDDYMWLLRTQAIDLVGPLYLIDLPSQGLVHAAIGHGLGNYGSGAADLMLRYFRIDIAAETMLEDSRSVLMKTIVEGGLVGVALLGGLFVATLRQSLRLVARATGADRRREIFLRYAYVAFFAAAMIQTSHYHFVLMAIIHARAADRSAMAHPTAQ